MLWANAGLAHGAYAIDEIDLGLFDTLVKVNVLGPILNVRAALPALKESGGNVVITASLSGIKGRPDLSIYQSSKGAAVMLTRSLAAELGQFGIRGNSVCPLASNTAMMSTFLENRPQDPAAFLQAVAQSVPLGRLVSPDDVAYAALFLASDHAGMITGVNLPVDGGASTQSTADEAARCSGVRRLAVPCPIDDAARTPRAWRSPSPASTALPGLRPHLSACPTVPTRAYPGHS
ncbi:SDR family oxidoreductase [Streptomyces sp. NPDC006356]